MLEELGSTPGLNTRGLPALLLWVCRKGCEFEFMAAPVLAAARALGLNLDVQLHITGAVCMRLDVSSFVWFVLLCGTSAV